MLADRMTRRRPLSLARVVVTLALAIGLPVAFVGTAVPTSAADSAPVDVAIVVPLVLPAGTTGFADAEALAQYTSSQGLLTRELDAVINRPVAIAIDPAILVSIRLLGSSAPPSALAWLDRLESASNETFALAYADADITLATQAGSDLVPRVRGLEFAIDPALFTAVQPEPSPSATPDVETPTLPTTESLLDWPHTLTDVAWPRENTVTSSDLPAMAASGYLTTILSSSNVSSGNPVPFVSIDGAKTLISNDAVSAALRAAVDARTDSDWEAALATLISVIAQQGGATSTVLATLDRSIPESSSRLADTLARLGLASSISSTGLAEILATPPFEASLTDQAQPAEDVEAVGDLLAAEAEDAQFATVGEDPAAITGPGRFALLALLSNQWNYNADGRVIAMDDYLAASESLRSAVSVVKASGVDVYADRAALPIMVQNELSQTVTVYITVRPDTGLLAIGESRVMLEIEPNSQGRAPVPYQAISNGTVQVTISLESASGAPIGTPARAAINVRAGWETPVVVVIAALMVALFVVGLVRSILRRRKTQNG